MAAVLTLVLGLALLWAVPGLGNEVRPFGRLHHAPGYRGSRDIFSGHSFASRHAWRDWRTSRHNPLPHFLFSHRGIIIHRSWVPYGSSWDFSRRYIPLGPAPLVLWANPPVIGRYDPAMRAPEQEIAPSDHRPLISLMLERRDELGLSPEQIRNLEQLRHDYRRAAIRADADLRIAEMDLERLLQSEPVDLVQVETKLREIEGLKASQRFVRIRTIEQGKALLSVEQREKLRNLGEFDPPPSVAEVTPD